MNRIFKNVRVHFLMINLVRIVVSFKIWSLEKFEWEVLKVWESLKIKSFNGNFNF